jgi:hypothetical protein
MLKLVNLANCRNACLERARYATRMARFLKADEELAFAAGLLPDFRIPVSTHGSDRKYDHFTSQRVPQRASFVDFKTRTFG